MAVDGVLVLIEKVAPAEAKQSVIDTLRLNNFRFCAKTIRIVDIVIWVSVFDSMRCCRNNPPDRFI